MYVIERAPREYVAPHGSEHSYVRNIEDAAKFPTREAALREACGNEHIVDVNDRFR